jgi:hypothetical protein
MCDTSKLPIYDPTLGSKFLQDFQDWSDASGKNGCGSAAQYNTILNSQSQTYADMINCACLQIPTGYICTGFDNTLPKTCVDGVVPHCNIYTSSCLDSLNKWAGRATTDGVASGTILDILAQNYNDDLKCLCSSDNTNYDKCDPSRDFNCFHKFTPVDVTGNIYTQSAQERGTCHTKNDCTHPHQCDSTSMTIGDCQNADCLGANGNPLTVQTNEVTTDRTSCGFGHHTDDCEHLLNHGCNFNPCITINGIQGTPVGFIPQQGTTRQNPVVVCKHEADKLVTDEKSLVELYDAMFIRSLGDNAQYDVINKIFTNYCISNYYPDTSKCMYPLDKDGNCLPMQTLPGTPGGDACRGWFNAMTSFYNDKDQTKWNQIKKPYNDAVMDFCQTNQNDPAVWKSDQCLCVNASVPNDSKYANEYTPLFNDLAPFKLGDPHCWMRPCRASNVAYTPILQDPDYYQRIDEGGTSICPAAPPCTSIIVNNGHIDNSKINIKCTGDPAYVKQIKYQCIGPGECKGGPFPVGDMPGNVYPDSATCVDKCGSSASPTPSPLSPSPPPSKSDNNFLKILIYILILGVIVMAVYIGYSVYESKRHKTGGSFYHNIF